MLRALLLLLAAAPASGISKMQCAIDGSAAAADAIDAGVFLWAASKRCDGEDSSKVNCGVDILSVLSATNRMCNVILGAVNECGALNTENADCGLAASGFSTAATAFMAAVGSAQSDCSGGTAGDMTGDTTDLGDCVADMSGTIESLFGSATAFRQIKQNCGDEVTCAANALHAMNALASIGGAVSASVKDCRVVETHGHVTDARAGCIADVVSAFGELSELAAAALELTQKCPVLPVRLYEAEQKVRAAEASSQTRLTVVLVPLAAAFSLLVGFLGGSRFTKARSHPCSGQALSEYEEVGLAPVPLHSERSLGLE